MADFLRKLDLAPTNADHVPPSGLASAAEFGDHIARKSRSELFWHHGIFKSKGQALGTYLVVDSFPHEGQPSVQTRTLEEFLGDDAEAAAIISIQSTIQQIICMSLSPLNATNIVWHSQPAVGLEAGVTKPDINQIGH